MERMAKRSPAKKATKTHSNSLKQSCAAFAARRGTLGLDLSVGQYKKTEKRHQKMQMNILGGKT